MQIILTVIVSLWLGFTVAWWLRKKEILELKLDLDRSKREMDEQINEGSSFEGFNEKIALVKENRKEKIVEHLRKSRETVQTNNVADLLDVSRASAYRYLEELENEGKIEQVGKAGRSVLYKLTR
ncbi:MAG: FaeA/PapI family transcriptional regulator [Candidatus Campbellbacteria bacterium]|nr:FaeA/PapI family transcriptional regulator [Candidatus Campbellbacteria bacterium]